MAGLKYDGRRLKQIQTRMKRLGGRQFRRELNTELGQDAMFLVHRGFETSADPYGRRWQGPKRRKGMPLLDTGRLRNSFSVRYTSAGFYLSSRTAYASYLQNGTRHMRARRMVPTQQRHSTIWYSRFRSTMTQVVARNMGRR